MGHPMKLTIQLHHGGSWHDAAMVTLSNPGVGVAGASSVSYEAPYFLEHGSIPFSEGQPLIDARAVSVLSPVDLEDRYFPGWPPFLLDLMPQGHARRKLSEHLGIDPDAPGSEVRLLLRGAGAPVGNLRIKEAAEAEVDRLRDAPRQGVTREDILDKSDVFLEVADRFAMIASGSSGLQGEWPKIAMTRAKDGLWYPDPVVADVEALAHVIVKLQRSNEECDRLILEGEAAYAAVAKEFGVRVGSSLVYRNGVLVIPRFDRRAGPGGLVRLGQESIVSAIGVSAFGHVEAHETYLEMIRAVSADPMADVAEYLKRELLNQAMGNPDNHGRNTALAKNSSGQVRLTPLFDFAPMRLAPADMGRPTKWACMRAAGRDHAPDWSIICAAAAGDDLDPDALLRILWETEDRVRSLTSTARRFGVPEAVIDRAIGDRPSRMADTLAAIPQPARTPR